jgi:membrane protein
MSEPGHSAVSGTYARFRSRPIVAVTIGTVAHFIKDDGFVLAGNLAFMALLSLFPFLIFLIALAGYVGQTEAGTYLVVFIFENIPDSVSEALEPPIIEVMQETRGGLLTVGILGALWTASNGLESLRTALNRAYDVTYPPSYLRRRAESVVMVVVAAVIIVSGMMGVVFGGIMWEELDDFGLVDEIPKSMWQLGRWGLSAALLYAAIAILYWILPARSMRARWILPGALLALGLWVAAGSLFSFYIRYFGQFAVTYGSLGGVILALVFFYVLGVIFILGAEMNAAIARHHDKSNRAEAAA